MTKLVHLYASQRVSRRAKDGKDGAPGKDAYRVDVSPSTLVFDTNENGVVDGSALSGKYATVTVYKGSQKISTDNLSLPSNYATPKYTNVDGKISNVNGEARITIDSIEHETISGDVTVSKSSGQISFPIDVLGERSTLMWVTVNVQVNVAKFTGSVAFDNKGYKAQFDELSNGGGAATKNDLTQATSKFEQTAREISLSVSEKSIGRRNLLVGSAFRRQGEVSYIVDSHPYFIRMNDGYGGTNCAYMSKSGMTQNVWCGAMWNPVTVKPNTKYTFSMMLKVMSFCDERFDVQFIDVTYNSSNSVAFDTLAASDKMETFGWTLKKITITTPSLCTKLRIDAFIRRNGTAYMCRPMLEEGENYNGWTLSEDDYEYVGGNILDNTRSLEKSGNLEKEESEIINEGYEYAYAVAHSNNTTNRDIEMLQWNVAGRINDGQDYMFSFLAKGTGMVSTYLWKDGTPRFFVESSNNKHNAVSSDGRVDFELTKEWKRYWVHYHLNTSSDHPLPEKLIIRCSSGNEVYICQPKLEIGATMTEFTERKTDLVDKASLKAAGINITSDMVELYGNQVKVSGAKGGTPVAMFENGMLNSNLINADKIMARQLQTTGSNGQSVSIENGLMMVYGTNGMCNIEFGVNSNGEAILSYYDKDGKWLYDLGPNKLDGGQLTESTLDGDKYVTAASFFGTNDFFSLKTYINVTVKQVDREYSQSLFGNNLFSNDDQEIANNNAAHIGYQPFARVSNVTNLYRYTAPRQSGTIIKDERYGLTTPALAKQADGKYFTSNSVLATNGQLTNLAPVGYYFRQSVQVIMAPSPMPSAGTQSARFPAYSIKWLNITGDSTGTVMNGFNSMMSYLMRTIKIQN